jgi:hypothetical protein
MGKTVREVLDSDGATGGRGLSTLAPWRMAVNTHLKKDRNWGSRGGHAPLGCLPLWGREGVTVSIALSALWEGFLQSPSTLNS